MPGQLYWGWTAHSFASAHHGSPRITRAPSVGRLWCSTAWLIVVSDKDCKRTSRVCKKSMCIVSSASDRSSLSPVGDIDQTFRGNLETTSAITTPSCTSQDPPPLRKRSRSDGELSPNSDQRISTAQLAQHSSEDDCWLVVKGKVRIPRVPFQSARCRLVSYKADVQVYDVTGWTEQHPGGRVVATYAGKDATDVFTCFHAATSWAQLKQFYVGELVVSAR